MNSIWNPIKKASLNKRRKSSFTLLEILIVIGILGILGGLIGINVRRAVQEERFRSEAGIVLRTLNLAQDLMLLLKQDVHVTFKSGGGKGIKYQMTFDFPLPEGWEKELTRSHPPLKSIHKVAMEDHHSRTQTQEGTLDLHFLSNGAVMSKGVLEISSEHQEKESKFALNRYICLPGYPTPFHLSQKIPTCSKDPTPFDIQLNELTRHEIHALQEKK